MNIKKTIVVAFTVAATILPLLLIAQTANKKSYTPANEQLKNYSSANSTTAPASDPGGNPDVPIDGGISLLVAAGVALGVKKVHAARQEKKSTGAAV